MRRKIIDVYWLSYLNDFFGIKLIFLRSELNVATFWLCMDAPTKKESIVWDIRCSLSILFLRIFKYLNIQMACCIQNFLFLQSKSSQYTQISYK